MAWKLGVVPYLNADPLAAALVEPDAETIVEEPVQVEALIPSRLIGALLAGEVDAALVSTAAVLPHPELRILPGMCVGSRGPVRSIKLYCRKPLEEVRTVALDASSRSAVALTRVLFAERWDLRPEYVTLPPDLGAMLEAADAALLIGDPALRTNLMLESGEWSGPAVTQYDLGAEWAALTGKPFVYAVWAARADLDLARLTRVLHKAKGWGMQRREMLAIQGARKLHLPFAVTWAYLTEAIHYDLGAGERSGVEQFCRLAVRHEVLPREAAVRFAEVSEEAAALQGVPR